MATYSNILAWKVLWTVEPEGLLSKGSRRVGYNWSDLACMKALEKEMASHSNILAWRIPGTGEPGRLPSTGSHRIGHNWSDLAAAAAGIAKYRGAPKDKQSQQSLASWGWCHWEGDELCWEPGTDESLRGVNPVTWVTTPTGRAWFFRAKLVHDFTCLHYCPCQVGFPFIWQTDTCSGL